ncbi:helix-turn-helix domain-containing protein [Acidimangrovimonas pyrenivorans]|uniref:Helix-turn-helix domain-containing protein n=1 Tax=Acidimangrovimonas pyrenivorans TaxID=2030798 RepID=A0ABV7ACY7_9RHOB
MSVSRKRASSTPADLRSVFGTNLRRLAAAEESVTALCAKLGINRTQFNRYLAGETFPRPDVLDRICRYFDVDARILLEPLEVQRPGPAEMIAGVAADLVLSKNDFGIDHERLPDGLYRFWRNSFNFPDKVISDMCRVYTQDGVKLFKGYELPNPMLSQAARQTPAESVYYGVFLQHDDGVSLYCATHAARMMSIGFFEYSLGGRPDFLGGISFLTRRRLIGMRRLSFSILERLPPGLPAGIAAARECGLRDMDKVPVKIRDLLATVPASI